MRKAIFIFIAVILVAVSIDWIHSCADLKSHKEVFIRYLTYADMYEYKDKDYDYVVRVPSFFNAQPDSLQEEKGRMRFDYADQWINLVIESHVINSEGMSLHAGMDSLAQMLNATEHRLGSDYFILSGPQCENGSRIDGYSYYSKVMVNHKLWFVYTMIYPDDYKDVLTRLFKEIDDWQIWERPHLQLKQGESQTPKAVSE
ncbi:MAG: hypothetical protein IKY01_01120 [Prevotella sp.]|nr:hypothetical protein [Prevotella sp.]